MASCGGTAASGSGCHNSPPLSKSPAWSPDGRSIAFARLVRGAPEVYVMRADGSDERKLTRKPTRLSALEGGLFSPEAWSPDGQRIAFVSRSGVLVVSRDGSSLRQLTRNPTDQFPAWSPDGREIAFLRSNGLTPLHIYVMNANGGNQHLLNVNVRNQHFPGRFPASGLWTGGPVWSPDGKKIAVAGGDYQLFVMNSDGTGLHVLVPIPRTTGSYQYSPTWSPNGRKIAFTTSSPEGGPTWLDVINADGSGHRQLTREAPDCQDENPAWSPDGQKIAFDKSGSGGGDPALYVMNADGSNQQQLGK